MSGDPANISHARVDITIVVVERKLNAICNIKNASTDVLTEANMFIFNLAAIFRTHNLTANVTNLTSANTYTAVSRYNALISVHVFPENRI